MRMLLRAQVVKIRVRRAARQERTIMTESSMRWLRSAAAAIVHGARAAAAGTGGAVVALATVKTVVALATVAGGALVTPALAQQTYADHPVRFILPFPPGGGTDLIGRLVGQRLSEQLGQPIMAQNRPGAGSHVGIELAAKAKPHGYTIVLIA